MDVFVARQAILDRSGNVYAYELLFRSNSKSQEFGEADPSAASSQVIANALLNFNNIHLLSGKKAFLNFNRPLLLEGLHAMLPKETSVIEILETVNPDADVIAACQAIHKQGYPIALDDFVDRPGMDALIGVADFIKVDMRATPRDEQERIVRAYRPRGLAMLAEKVETHEEFRWAASIGFDYFQGYYFARPVTVTGRQVPVSKVASLRLLRELQAPEIDFDTVEKIISADLGFSYKLLRYANSAAFGRRGEMKSIRLALSVLGERNIRRWVALAALPALAQDKPGELVTQSVMRAHFWEQLAVSAVIPDPGRLFLMGMFSLLDALIDRPLKEALRDIGVSAPIAAVLLCEAPADDPLAMIRKLALDYESGAWDEAIDCKDRLGIPGSDIVSAYSAALKWADEVLAASR